MTGPEDKLPQFSPTEKFKIARDYFEDLRGRYANARGMIRVAKADFPEVNDAWPGLELVNGIGQKWVDGFLFAHSRASVYLSRELIGIDSTVRNQMIAAIDAFREETTAEAKETSGLDEWCDGASYCYSRFRQFLQNVENQYDDMVKRDRH